MVCELLARYRVGRAIAFDDQDTFARRIKLAVGKRLQNGSGFLIALSDQLRNRLDLLVAFSEREFFDRIRLLRERAEGETAKNHC